MAAFSFSISSTITFNSPSHHSPVFVGELIFVEPPARPASRNVESISVPYPISSRPTPTLVTPPFSTLPIRYFSHAKHVSRRRSTAQNCSPCPSAFSHSSASTSCSITIPSVMAQKLFLPYPSLGPISPLIHRGIPINKDLLWSTACPLALWPTKLTMWIPNNSLSQFSADAIRRSRSLQDLCRGVLA